ncbi:22180_t:CDS:2 [Rhizophagus irregularis]|nr:22180_t:CDS:2 [Rhizophagus irregularis]
MFTNRYLYEVIELKDIKSNSRKYSDESGQEQHAKDVVTNEETVKPIVIPKVLFVDQYGHEMILLQDLKSKI